MWQYTLIALGVLLLYNYVSTGVALLKMQPEIVGFRFYKITLTDTIIQLDLRLTNLSTTAVTLQGVQFTIYINDTYMGSSSMPLNNVVNNYSSINLRLSVRISTSNLLTLLSNYISTSGNNYTLNIRLNGRVAGNGASYPIPLSFKVEIPTIVSLIKKIQELFKTGDKITDIANNNDGVSDTTLV